MCDFWLCCAGSTLSLTSMPGGSAWLMPRPGRLTSRNDLAPTVEEAGWFPGSVWRGVENLALPLGFNLKIALPNYIPQLSISSLRKHLSDFNQQLLILPPKPLFYGLLFNYILVSAHLDTNFCKY